MTVPIEKNKEYVVDIIDYGFEGEGIAKIDGFTIFIPNAIKGEKVKILIVKVLSSHGFGKIIEILKKSEHRIDVDCKTYKRCGGCNLRHIDYEETLNIKQNTVQNLVNKILKNKIDVKKTWVMGNPFFYRNKLQCPIGIDENNEPIVGVYANRSHEIIEMKNCMIQNQESLRIVDTIINELKKYNISVYNEKTHKGLVRNLVIKKGVHTGEILVIFVINGEDISKLKKISEELINRFQNIKSVVANVNKAKTNVVLGNNNINIYGNGYIEDILGEYVFKISTNSFYQINPVQAEALYNIALENTNITKNDVVFDLYCGVGTISIFASKFAKKVYGVEIVKQAIDDAIDNAKRNNIDNVEFLVGDTEFVLEELIEKKKILPDVIIVDPPRKGLDKTTIGNILKIKPKKISYISCNPATLIRDLAFFEDDYNIEFIQPVDMFPWTSHVECVAVMKLIYMKLEN